MSHSYRKTPIMGLCADSDKQDKQLARRRLRRKVKNAIKQSKEILPVRNEVSDPWSFAKDGKQKFDPKDPKNKKYMRK